MNWLKGKKTYLVALLMFAVNGLAAIGVLTRAQADAIFALLASLGLITVRLAIADATKKK